MVLDALEGVNRLSLELREHDLPTRRQHDVCALVGSEVATHLLSQRLVWLAEARRKLDDRDTDAMALLLDGIDLLKVLHHVPVLVDGAQQTSACHVAAFLLVGEHKKLADRNWYLSRVHTVRILVHELDPGRTAVLVVLEVNNVKWVPG